MDIAGHNRHAWDREVARGNPWTIPFGPEIIAEARRGKWELYLTPVRPVPRDWLPPFDDCDLLCLAGGGGQQGPLLAAAGARVTVLDNSPAQLAQDRLVAERESLALTTIEGEMADLSALADESFDLVINPVSNVFTPDLQPVWRETWRVLRPGGILLVGFDNPIVHAFDWDLVENKGELRVIHPLPWSDAEDLDKEQLQRYRQEQIPFEFSHSLETQIGGQTEAGFIITGLFEDRYPPEEKDAVSLYLPHFIVTKAMKVNK
ncbi:MAG: class I SAM-dependent methyltransferase [Candidatus Delongbacteria bacterium]|nr:class I SAM-dependent methyltransferase [Candidatus Delongbacteria bacterium]